MKLDRTQEAAAYLEVDRRMNGDVSEKAYTAVVLRSTEAIEKRMIDEQLCAAARNAVVGRDGWVDVDVADDGAQKLQRKKAVKPGNLETGRGRSFPRCGDRVRTLLPR